MRAGPNSLLASGIENRGQQLVVYKDTDSLPAIKRSPSLGTNPGRSGEQVTMDSLNNQVRQLTTHILQQDDLLKEQFRVINDAIKSQHVEILSLKNNVGSLSEDVKSLNGKLDSVIAENKSLKEEVGSLKESFDKEVGSLKESFDKEVGSLNGKLDSVITENKSLKEEVGSLKKEVGSLKESFDKEVGSLKKEVGSLNGKLNKVITDVGNLATSVTQWMHGGCIIDKLIGELAERRRPSGQ